MEEQIEVEIEDELCGDPFVLLVSPNANISELMAAHRTKAFELGHGSTFMRPSHYVVDGSARKIGPKEEIGESVEVRVTSGASSVPLPSESSPAVRYEINLDHRFADFFFDLSQKGSGMHTCILSEDRKELELKNAEVTITLYRTQRVQDGMIDFVLTEKTSDPIPMVALGSTPLHKKAPEDLLKKKGAFAHLYQKDAVLVCVSSKSRPYAVRMSIDGKDILTGSPWVSSLEGGLEKAGTFSVVVPMSDDVLVDRYPEGPESSQQIVAPPLTFCATSPEEEAALVPDDVLASARTLRIELIPSIFSDFRIQRDRFRSSSLFSVDQPERLRATPRSLGFNEGDTVFIASRNLGRRDALLRDLAPTSERVRLIAHHSLAVQLKCKGGRVFTVEVPSLEMRLWEFLELLEREVGVPVEEQVVFYGFRPLKRKKDLKKSLKSCLVRNGCVMYLLNTPPEGTLLPDPGTDDIVRRESSVQALTNVPSEALHSPDAWSGDHARVVNIHLVNSSLYWVLQHQLPPDSSNEEVEGIAEYLPDGRFPFPLDAKPPVKSRCDQCHGSPVTLLLEPCGHCLCGRCASQIVGQCPVCQGDLFDFIFVEPTSHDGAESEAESEMDVADPSIVESVPDC
eukprot:TRINITY_DN1499_c0_g1_i1.p1 TRINITY_DN1499_c0_g1~~TRINITY_DN1499_c0_g1_i1.p1  ORF type:complete len:625 (+),score=164.29 TRINITY_DN1499_c0_g1_i1:131-2005(+)